MGAVVIASSGGQPYDFIRATLTRGLPREELLLAFDEHLWTCPDAERWHK